MNCYYHPDREAVDTCYICKKHICKECKHVITDKVICTQCSIAVVSRAKKYLKDKDEQTTEERRQEAYIWPVLLAFASLLFFGFFAGTGEEFFLYIGAIFLAIAVIFFIMARRYVKRKLGEKGKTKLTKKKVIGWLLTGFGAVFLALLPGIPIELNVWGSILLVMILFMCIILGLIFALGRKGKDKAILHSKNEETDNGH